MENKAFRLVVFGSRTLGGGEIRQIILDEIKATQATVIVTPGETKGVCEEARLLCQEISMPLKLYWLDKSRAAGQYDHRSRAILADADHVLLIHDGVSKGTRNELKLVKKLQLPFNYIVIADASIVPQNEKLEDILAVFK